MLYTICYILYTIFSYVYIKEMAHDLACSIQLWRYAGN